jgi:hypothetical protein
LGAEEARSNEAELELEDLFIFFGCSLEKKMFGFGLGLARGRGGVSRADLASWSAGGVGGRHSRGAGAQETDALAQMSVGHRMHKNSAVCAASRHVGP